MPEFSEGDRAYLRSCATTDILHWLSTFSDEDAHIVLNHVRAGLDKRHEPAPVVEQPPPPKRKHGVGIPYTDEEKAEILAYVETHTVAETVHKFGVSKVTIRNWGWRHPLWREERDGVQGSS